MEKELDDLLCRRYPLIFVDRHAPMNTTCMCWGFSCGSGWFWLIDKLCYSIQNHIDQHNSWILKYPKESDKPIPQVVAVQIKEKFSGLRFYYNGGDDDIAGMISFASNLSYSICEDCGSLKDIGQTMGGWMTTLCKECFDKRKQKNIDKNYEFKQDFELRENVYDRYADIRELKENDICYFNDKKCIFIRHVNEYQKEVNVDGKIQIIERYDLYLDEEKE